MKDNGYDNLPRLTREELDAQLSQQREAPSRRGFMALSAAALSAMAGFLGCQAKPTCYSVARDPEPEAPKSDIPQDLPDADFAPKFDIRKVLPDADFEPKQLLELGEHPLDPFAKDFKEAIDLYKCIRDKPVLCMTPEEFNETRQAFKKSTFEDFDTFVFKMLCYVPSDAASFIEEANQIILFRFRKYLDAPEEQLSADQVAFRKQAVQTLENDLKDAYQRFITNAKKDHHISDETIENHLKYLNQKYCSDSQKKESTDE